MGTDDVAQRCLRRHSMDIATITGLYLFVGVFFGGLVVAIPAKPGEEAAKLGIAVFALCWLVAGVVHRWITKRKRDRMAALLGPARSQLTRATRVEIRRRHTRSYAVDLLDNEGVTLRLTAPNVQDADELAARLR